MTLHMTEKAMSKKVTAIQKAAEYVRSEAMEAERRKNEYRPRVHDVRVEGIPASRDVYVDDPLEPGAKLLATQSLRDDPLGRMHRARTIDDAQYKAGRDLQGYYEAAEIGGVKAMDTTKEPVDGGGIADTLTERIQHAIRQIERLEHVLGKIDASIVRDVLAKGMFLRDVARVRNQESKLAYRYFARRFRAALELLAREMGYAG